jgi:hypothetical protein
MAKKIVMLSLGGSEGKTTLAVQLLHTHLPDAKILCVDSANETAADFGIKKCEKHSGAEFNTTYHALMSEPGDVIVDVGGNKECKEFINGMLEVEGSDEVTTFIIPSKAESKGQSAAIETIARLIRGGVNKSKIKVIFMAATKPVEEEFSEVVAGMKEHGLVPDLDLVLTSSKLYNDLIKHKEIIAHIVNDETDFKEKAANRKKGDETDYIEMLIRQKMARITVWPDIQRVYQHLFKD